MGRGRDGQPKIAAQSAQDGSGQERPNLKVHRGGEGHFVCVFTLHLPCQGFRPITHHSMNLTHPSNKQWTLKTRCSVGTIYRHIWIRLAHSV